MTPEQWIEDLRLVNPGFAELAETAQNLFIDRHKDLTLGIKYGGIIFERQGELIGGIFAYTKHISVEFSQGASFTDSQKLLQGKGKLRRHIKLVEPDDVENKQLSVFVEQA